MEIIVNGQRRDIKDKSTVLQLLNELQVKEKTMAVAINMEIVKKEQWEKHTIHEGDKLELLHFVGGG